MSQNARNLLLGLAMVMTSLLTHSQAFVHNADPRNLDQIDSAGVYQGISATLASATVRPDEYDVIDQIGGASQVVARFNRAVLLGVGSRVARVDATERMPSEFNAVSQSLPGIVSDILIYRDYVIVGLDTGTIVILQNEHAGLRYVSMFEFSIQIRRMVTIDHYLIVGRRGGVLVLDLSDITQIKEVTRLVLDDTDDDSNDWVVDLLAVGSVVYAYTFENYSAILRIIDSTMGFDLSGAFPLEINPSGRNHQLAVFEDNLYVIAPYSGVLIIDITDRANPIPRARFGIEGLITSLQVHEGSLWATTWNESPSFGTLRRIDLSDPARLVQAALLEIPRWYPTSVEWYEQTAYVVDDDGGVSLIDISARDPVRTAYFRYPRLSDAIMEGADRYLYVSESGAGMWMMDRVRLHGTDGNDFLETGTVNAIEWQQEHLFVLRPKSLAIYDRTEFGQLRLVSEFQPQIDDASEMVKLAVRGAHAYIAIDTQGQRTGDPSQTSLLALDVSAPSTPAQIGTVTYSRERNEWTTAIAVVDKWVFIARRTIGIHMVDVSDPQQMKLLDRVAFPGDYRDLAGDRAMLYAAGQHQVNPLKVAADGMLSSLKPASVSGDIVDVDIDLDRSALMVAYRFSTPIATQARSGVAGFDISVPEDIRMVLQQDLFGDIDSVAIVDDLIYAACDEAGLLVIGPENIVHQKVFLPWTAFGSSPISGP